MLRLALALLGNEALGGNVAQGPGGMAAGGGISIGYFGPDGGNSQAGEARTSRAGAVRVRLPHAIAAERTLGGEAPV